MDWFLYDKESIMKDLTNKKGKPNESSIKDNLLCNHTPSLDDCSELVQKDKKFRLEIKESYEIITGNYLCVRHKNR